MSGLNQQFAKLPYGKLYRGFESPSLRKSLNESRQRRDYLFYRSPDESLLSKGAEGKMNKTRRIHLSFVGCPPGITTERSEVVIPLIITSPQTPPPVLFIFPEFQLYLYYLEVILISLRVLCTGFYNW